MCCPGRSATVIAAVLTGLSPALAEDSARLDVESIPRHGLVVADLDLTAVATWCRWGNLPPQNLAVADYDTGARVPAQFVPSPGYDPVTNVSGMLVMQLKAVDKARLRLTSDRAAAPVRIRERPAQCVVTTDVCRVSHASGKMGGLPHRFEFAQTGKVFQDFRWHDRLYDPDHGSFFLFDDPAAQIERLASGPLATVVQTFARYVRPGQVPPISQPVAVYQWCYLKDLPLVRITATATQRPGKPWRESHFLELNFPGDDFASWAGGEPVGRERFEGKTRSVGYEQWAALLDGRSAIAMMDCGRVLVYDHKGGSYLQSHGDRAWQPWPEQARSWSAWLWLGTATDPVDAVRSARVALPTHARMRVMPASVEAAIDVARTRWRKVGPAWRCLAAASQLAEQGQYALAMRAANGAWPKALLVAEAEELGLVVHKHGTGVHLLSLFDKRLGRECLVSAGLPLFEITLRHAGRTVETVRLAADAGWRDVRVTSTATAGLQIRCGSPADDRLRGLTVEVSAMPDMSASALIWDLAVTPPETEWALWQVTFPNLAVREPGPDPVVFVPRAAGQLETDAWRRRWRCDGRYPSGWTSMPYLAAYAGDGSSGVYVGVHDPAGGTKEIRAGSRPESRSVDMSVEHPVPNMGTPGVAFELPGTVVWRRMSGDWFDAAMVYRQWVREEARWYPKLGGGGRSDTPLWVRKLSVWAQGGGDPRTGLPELQAFREKMGLPIGFHWYNWHQVPFDNDYPHYFPADEGFADTVKLLQEKQIHVMPYINGRLWDTRDRGTNDYQFTRLARPAATKDDAGEPYVETYGSKETDGSKVCLAAMCPATELWQGKVEELVLRLMTQTGVQGVYIDQVAAAKPQLCFDPSHGHPLGGGSWWTESYWQMLDRIRGHMPTGRMLTTECNAEPYLKWFDGYLTWHWQYDGQVPAFAAVYGGSVQMFGRAYRGGATKDLALRMKAGQQLVYGEQIGWISPSVVNEPGSFAFLRQVAHLRSQFSRYFYAGQMGRPPRLGGDIPRVTADWQWQGVWPVTTPVAMTGAWELPNENRAVLLMVNVGDAVITSRLVITAAEYGVRGEQVRLKVSSGTGEGEVDTVTNRFQREVSLPPRTAVAWELRP